MKARHFGLDYQGRYEDEEPVDGPMSRDEGLLLAVILLVSSIASIAFVVWLLAGLGVL